MPTYDYRCEKCGNEFEDFYSMDDADDYGNEFHHYSFKDAIDAGVIADYEIIIEIYDDGTITKKIVVE